MPTPLPLVRGTLDTLVLRALTWAPMHGFEISEWLENQSKGVLEVDDSALYQAVYRLEGKGFIDADWGITENNRKARYYRLSATGRAHLLAETKRWVKYAETVTTILTVAPANG